MIFRFYEAFIIGIDTINEEQSFEIIKLNKKSMKIV